MYVPLLLPCIELPSMDYADAVPQEIRSLNHRLFISESQLEALLVKR